MSGQNHKYKKQAANILFESGLFNEGESKELIYSIKSAYTKAFAGAPAWFEKYLKGIARILVEAANGDRSKAVEILQVYPNVFQEYLAWVRVNRDNYGIALDDEFINTITYEELVNKVTEIKTLANLRSDIELSEMSFDKPSDYKLVPIYSYSDLNKLYGGNITGDGTDKEDVATDYTVKNTSWCIANSEEFYNTFVRDLSNRLFILQKNNYKELTFNKELNEQMLGKDEYGNSLISIIVNKDGGGLAYVSLRCNHIGIAGIADLQYCTYAELSKIAGFDVQKAVLSYINNEQA